MALRTRSMRLFLAGLLIALALATGCGRLLGGDAEGDGPSTAASSRDGSTTVLEAETPDTGDYEEPDGASPIDASPDGPLHVDAEADAGACIGKPNGSVVAGTSKRCCSSQEVDLRAADNCGACGIKCPVGFACAEVAPGQWGCHCATDVSCVGAGYGPGATCYGVNGQFFCNCQCPGAGNSTCSGVCPGGATCVEVTGQNYCTYDL